MPINSVKDALLEAVAERENDEDTALIASIFYHIAQAIDKVHAVCSKHDPQRRNAISSFFR